MLQLGYVQYHIHVVEQHVQNDLKLLTIFIHAIYLAVKPVQLCFRGHLLFMVIGWVVEWVGSTHLEWKGFKMYGWAL